jgi:triphosphoribosyl-dephospho-CoA synthetase
VTLADAASAHIREHTDPDLRRQLGRIGRQAETAMLDATGGVHTHPGAISASASSPLRAVHSRTVTAREVALVAAEMASVPDDRPSLPRLPS